MPSVLTPKPDASRYVYDAFGRITEYRKDVNDAATAIVKYQYNGLNQRIGWQYDVDASATLSTSEQFYFVFDNRWRIVATVRAGDANPREAFAYHAAGIGGSGNSSYIDSVIMREKDANTAWTSASDGTLEERVYYVQNWRSDVVALLDAVSNPLEEIRYSAYGTPSVHPIADVNHDGLVNSTDQAVWGDLFNEIPSTGVYAHNNLNRDELFPSDLDDDSFFSARYAATSGTAYGFNKLSSLGNRKGYAGYEWDVSATVWHVRHRVLDSASGKWTRMDPLGYVDGASVYEYVASAVVVFSDSLGLAAVRNQQGGSFGQGSLASSTPIAGQVPWEEDPRILTERHRHCGNLIQQTCGRGGSASGSSCYRACAAEMWRHCDSTGGLWNPEYISDEELIRRGIDAKRECSQEGVEPGIPPRNEYHGPPACAAEGLAYFSAMDTLAWSVAAWYLACSLAWNPLGIAGCITATGLLEAARRSRNAACQALQRCELANSSQGIVTHCQNGGVWPPGVVVPGQPPPGSTRPGRIRQGALYSASQPR